MHRLSAALFATGISQVANICAYWRKWIRIDAVWRGVELLDMREN